MKGKEVSQGRRMNRTIAAFTAVFAVCVLGACASTAPQYYSLVIPRMSEEPAAPVDTDYAVSVQPVIVPEQVARPQIVVRTEVGAEVMPLNAALWAGPLESQIRTVLSDALSRQLNVLDLPDTRAADKLPVWQVFLDVVRFESIYDRSVRQEVTWRLTPQGMPSQVRQRVCSAELETPVGIGMSALVEGHNEILRVVAALIAETLPWKPAAPSGTKNTRSANTRSMAELTQASISASTSAPSLNTGGNVGSVSVQFRGCAG